MLEVLSNNAEISRFLSQFPKHQWRKAIESATVLGIRQISHSSPNGVSFSDLIKFSGIEGGQISHTSVFNFQNDLKRMTEAVEDIAIKRRQPPRPSKRKLSATSMKHSSSKPIAKVIPSRLKNVESKIKEDIKRDIQLFSNRRQSLEIDQPIINIASSSPYESKENHRPQTCSPPISEPLCLENFSSYNNIEPSHDDNLLKIADEFLKNPFDFKHKF